MRKSANAGICGDLTIGPERYEPRDGIAVDQTDMLITAFSGTGFNPDNPQHQIGTDAVRYAIGIQQHRDAGEYHRADAIRVAISKTYVVANGPGWTRIAMRDPIRGRLT